MECLSSFDIILCQMWLGVPLAMFLWILPLEQDKLANIKLVKKCVSPTISSDEDSSEEPAC